MWQVGDPVVYHVSKFGVDPSPRACEVHPAAYGETYSYVVEKYWRVAEVHPNGDLVLVTRRGKQHIVHPDDPCLRKAHWWERWLYGHRFPDLERVRQILAKGSIPEKTRTAS
ncbi:MAG: hypothetical protein KatS3mg113_0865 [Planctomycetaceae bacterium]|nr:MAG: hypothetical protein KatS3mg113_0865 [Planctomycetaceae bacterium]